jgi:ankyrin repeat protein
MITRFFQFVFLVALMGFGQAAVQAQTTADLLKAIEQDDEKSVREALLRGVSPNALTEDGVPLISYAMIKGANKSVRFFLLSKKLDVNVQDLRGDTPLMVASMLNRSEWVAALLSKGADLNHSGKWTALHYAAASGGVKAMSMLIEAGADLNAFSPNGTTPLMMAAREGKTDAVRLLLSHGVDPNVVNQSGYNAAGYATRAKNKELALEIMRYAKERKSLRP